jgi:hypothetical protein
MQKSLDAPGNPAYVAVKRKRPGGRGATHTRRHGTMQHWTMY